MRKYFLPGTEFLALILTGIFVIYVADIPADKDHASQIVISAVIIFSLTNAVAFGIKRLIAYWRSRS